MDTRRIIITGVNGFVGHHLAQALHAEGFMVIGVGHDAISPKLEGIVSEYHKANLIETWPNVDNVDGVIHLAGLAAVGPSFEAPQRYINGNSAMVTNMCEYYIRQEKKPRILILSSGAVYDSNQTMPISEDGAISFSSPYAISKVTTEHQAAYYRKRGLDCIVARPFNHSGPGQKSGFIIPDFYEKIRSAEQDGIITVGNIETKRDYTDVRDVVTAYTGLIGAKTLTHTIYNVCSGVTIPGSQILDTLKTELKRPDITFKIDESLIRPTDAPNIVGDASRLKQELGWQPTHSLTQTIHDFVEAN